MYSIMRSRHPCDVSINWTLIKNIRERGRVLGLSSKYIKIMIKGGMRKWGEQKIWDLHCQDITFRVDKTIMRNVEDMIMSFSQTVPGVGMILHLDNSTRSNSRLISSNRRPATASTNELNLINYNPFKRD